MTNEEKMTPEEAIAEISFLKVAVNKVMEQALDMAIKALSQEPIDCANAKHDADGCLGYSNDIGGYSYCQTCLECPKASINNWDKEQEPCDDVVSRQAVDDYIVKLLDGYLYDEERTRLEGLCAYLWELPPVTQKSGKWIPVSERLPEDGTWNLFTDGKNASVERYKSDALDHFYPNGRWFSLAEVVAWMPLPKPYEPQESEAQTE